MSHALPILLIGAMLTAPVLADEPDSTAPSIAPTVEAGSISSLPAIPRADTQGLWRERTSAVPSRGALRYAARASGLIDSVGLGNSIVPVQPPTAADAATRLLPPRSFDGPASEGMPVPADSATVRPSMRGLPTAMRLAEAGPIATTPTEPIGNAGDVDMPGFTRQLPGRDTPPRGRAAGYLSPFPGLYSMAPPGEKEAAATAAAEAGLPTPTAAERPWVVPSPPPLPPVVFHERSDTITRFGWWGGGYNGSPLNVGMYEGLRSFPFVDVDSLRSNGRGTLDFWGSVLNSESYDFRSQAFQNGYKARFDFEQFPHQLLHQPPVGGTRDSTNQVVSEDLNLGQDYAVRVQQLRADFAGPLTEHISWKVKLFGFRKFGERQANSMAHCFNINAVGGAASNRCHVVSQGQRIDWLTMEIEPGLLAKFDRLTIDYARTMRQFTANDQVTYAPFNHFGAFGGGGDTLTVYPYAVVPNSTFQMDRLKIGYDFSQSLRLYSYLYQGLMTNLNRDTHNQFGGFDIRLIKTTESGITGTAYAKLNDLKSELPPFLLPEERADPTMIRHPLNYNRFWEGLDGQWFPFRTADPFWQGLSFRANYEFHEIDRQYANYPTDIPANYVVPPTVTNAVVTGKFFNQPNTTSHQFVLSQRMRWTSGVITFARYQMTLTDNPIYGLQSTSGVLNSNQSNDDQLFEIGGSWSPLRNLLFSARAAFESSWLSSRYANFSQNNYPVLATVWYAPTDKLSVSAGYSYFSNWVNQDVTFGFRGQDEPPPAETLRVGYNGQTQILNVGARYAYTEKLIFSGGIFWMNGFNIFNVPASQTGADWTNMPNYSNIRAESMRYQGGFDYMFNRRVGCYFRVNVFDYQDNSISQGFGTGTSAFFLAGLSGVF